jgi:membrane protease subunit HflC
VAEAEKQAQIIRGEGDRQATLIWNETAGKDPDFYEFFRSLEAYRQALGHEGNSFVFSPDAPFFKYLKGMNR